MQENFQNQMANVNQRYKNENDKRKGVTNDFENQSKLLLKQSEELEKRL